MMWERETKGINNFVFNVSHYFGKKEEKNDFMYSELEWI